VLWARPALRRNTPGAILAPWPALSPTRESNPMKTSFPRQDIRVLLLEGVSQSAVDTFHAAGYSQVEIYPKSLPEDQLRAKIADAHIVGIRSRTQLTGEVLGNARRLMAIGCFCIGANQVDTNAAELAGIPVFNAPYSNTRSVA
jgi:D-3-phosphoglycerate dehydrogenase